jgi:hypothetical protein
MPTESEVKVLHSCRKITNPVIVSLYFPFEKWPVWQASLNFISLCQSHPT